MDWPDSDKCHHQWGLIHQKDSSSEKPLQKQKLNVRQSYENGLQGPGARNIQSNGQKDMY